LKERAIGHVDNPDPRGRTLCAVTDHLLDGILGKVLLPQRVEPVVLADEKERVIVECTGHLECAGQTFFAEEIVRDQVGGDKVVFRELVEVAY
jgi:hypothetical protein